jgi:hypothetical protein
MALVASSATISTLLATLAKALPNSSARAASIVAWRARRLVCPAILFIRPKTPPNLVKFGYGILQPGDRRMGFIPCIDSQT